MIAERPKYSTIPDSDVEVLIAEIATSTPIAVYRINFDDANVVNSRTGWFDEAWRLAIADGLVNQECREAYRFDLNGNLSVNEAIDNAYLLNKQFVRVRGAMIWALERQALCHLPRVERRLMIETYHPGMNRRDFLGSDIWIDASNLDISYGELRSKWRSEWVCISGTIQGLSLHRKEPNKLVQLFHGFTSSDFPGYGFFSSYPAEICASEIVNLVDLRKISARTNEAK